MIQLTQAGPDITCKPLFIPPLQQLSLIIIKDNQVPVVVWTCMEAAVGITAACLSHIRPLFNVKLWTRLRTPSQEPEKRQLNSSTSEAFSTDRTLFDPCGTQTTIYSGHEACVEAGKA